MWIQQKALLNTRYVKTDPTKLVQLILYRVTK